MWIVTQDGDKLINTDNMSIIGATNSGKIQAVEHPFDEMAIDLGQYSSKENALEVLWEIEKLITNTEHGYIFDMPQNDCEEV